MPHLRIKIDLEKKGLIGPGKIQLLELIQKHGSIRSAAAAMDMSYRRAWLLLKELENLMGSPAIAPETGGLKGGGTKLTELGEMLVNRFRAIEKRASDSVASELRQLMQISSASVRPGRKTARK